MNKSDSTTTTSITETHSPVQHFPRPSRSRSMATHL